MEMKGNQWLPEMFFTEIWNSTYSKWKSLAKMQNIHESCHNPGMTLKVLWKLWSWSSAFTNYCKYVFNVFLSETVYHPLGLISFEKMSLLQVSLPTCRIFSKRPFSIWFYQLSDSFWYSTPNSTVLLSHAQQSVLKWVLLTLAFLVLSAQDT